MSPRQFKLVLTLISMFLVFDICAETIRIVDDIGRTLKLSSPATRIISLAPHITENLFTLYLNESNSDKKININKIL